MWDAAQLPENTFEADAIAVLAGGNGRIKAAIDALHTANYNTRLLISGAHPDHTDPYKLMDYLGYGATMANRIDVQANAIDTEGNALEIGHWLEENPNIQNLLIVTSEYHIPRAELELSKVLPC